MVKKIFFIASAILLHLCLNAQTREITDPAKKTDWWGDVDGYLNQQAKVSLDLVNRVLEQHQPALEQPLERKMALLMIDNVLHEEKAASRPAVQDFLRTRIEKAIQEISTEKVKKGAVIWKLYNHTFVVKTSTVTIGFDIQRGLTSVEGMTLDQKLVQSLIDEVDILFISHFHRDHADPWVAEMFLNQNKPVVTPPDLWNDRPFYQKITHPEREAALLQKVRLPARDLTIQFVCNPGHQGKQIPNNVYLVFSPEGLSFSHTGDQSNPDDFAWIDQVGANYRVDVLMCNSWSVYPDHRLVRGFRPQLTLPGHENEMGHTIDHREPYWLNDMRLGNPKEFAWIQLIWGEKIRYFPQKKK